MNWNEQDLTAYALGELSREQEHAIREELAANAQAQAELADLETVTDALQHGAPVPLARLTDQQRELILRPAQMPRFIKPMAPRQVVRAQPSRWAAVPGVVGRIAAAACIAAGAFYLGQHVGQPVSGTSQVVASPQGGAAPSKSTAPEKATLLVKSVPTDVAPSPVLTANVPAAVVASAPAPSPKVESAAPVAVTPAAVATQKPLPAPVPVSSPAAPALAESAGFIATARQGESKITIRPYETRPAPVKLKPGEALASPLSAKPAAATPAKPARKERAPDLLIHSWKAEVAACPWDESHRLLRVLVQLPADQAASTSPEFAYPLKVAFDSGAVRGHRLLSEHHARPENGDTTAAHVLWYEVVPVRAGTDIPREPGRAIASITLDDARFSSQKVGPFDDTRLLAMDRGQSWRGARQDFMFETAIVGFKLLLQGREGIGSLNLDLVLDLARQAAGDTPSPEAVKFIRVIQEAKRATGL